MLDRSIIKRWVIAIRSFYPELGKELREAFGALEEDITLEQLEQILRPVKGIDGFKSYDWDDSTKFLGAVWYPDENTYGIPKPQLMLELDKENLLENAHYFRFPARGVT